MSQETDNRNADPAAADATPTTQSTSAPTQAPAPSGAPATKRAEVSAANRAASATQATPATQATTLLPSRSALPPAAAPPAGWDPLLICILLAAVVSAAASVFACLTVRKMRYQMESGRKDMDALRATLDQFLQSIRINVIEELLGKDQKLFVAIAKATQTMRIVSGSSFFENCSAQLETLERLLQEHGWSRTGGSESHITGWRKGAVVVDPVAAPRKVAPHSSAAANKSSVAPGGAKVTQAKPQPPTTLQRLEQALREATLPFQKASQSFPALELAIQSILNLIRSNPQASLPLLMASGSAFGDRMSEYWLQLFKSADQCPLLRSQDSRNSWLDGVRKAMGTLELRVREPRDGDLNGDHFAEASQVSPSGYPALCNAKEQLIAKGRRRVTSPDDSGAGKTEAAASPQPPYQPNYLPASTPEETEQPISVASNDDELIDNERTAAPAAHTLDNGNGNSKPAQAAAPAALPMLTESTDPLGGELVEVKTRIVDVLDGKDAKASDTFTISVLEVARLIRERRLRSDNELNHDFDPLWQAALDIRDGWRDAQPHATTELRTQFVDHMFKPLYDLPIQGLSSDEREKFDNAVRTAAAQLGIEVFNDATKEPELFRDPHPGENVLFRPALRLLEGKDRIAHGIRKSDRR